MSLFKTHVSKQEEVWGHFHLSSSHLSHPSDHGSPRPGSHLEAWLCGAKLLSKLLANLATTRVDASGCQVELSEAFLNGDCLGQRPSARFLLHRNVQVLIDHSQP